MRLEITRVEGLRNDLVLRLDRAEIETALLSVAHRDRLMGLPGMVRHRPASTEEMQGITAAKVPLETHLQALAVVGADGRATRRAVAISNRNLGTNHGHVAWQRTGSPRIFRIAGDPVDYQAHSCLAESRYGDLSIEDFRFDLEADRLHRAGDGRDVSDEVEWATFGQRVLRGGAVVRVEEIIEQFYDLRHVLAFDQQREAGEALRQQIYRGYPETFRVNALRLWREGVPRARYVHGALGVSPTEVIVVQREGTIEEIAAALRDAGAEDGIILDNGGSVACWVWWANHYAGGIVSPTVDYRPPGTSAIVFVLRGPANVDLPGGSVSYSVS